MAKAMLYIAMLGCFIGGITVFATTGSHWGWVAAFWAVAIPVEIEHQW